VTTPAAKWKAAERARHKAAGRVAVTVWIYPADRDKLARYIKRLNERALYAEALIRWRDGADAEPANVRAERPGTAGEKL
jgi:hypothetical protein